jgi:hypothetical protein
MNHVQFRAIPPLAKVQELFVVVTSSAFYPGAVWNTWISQPTPAPFEVFRPYIRPSHQTLLNALVAGTAPSPCPFLRQLLRPHNYRIESVPSGWQLSEDRPPQKTIAILPKKTHISWD